MDTSTVQTKEEDKSKGQEKAKENGQEKETGRLEAFSDGVFAVAVTLLVLDIKIPVLDQLPKGHQTLAEGLLDQWPAYLAYFTSFLTILVMWINHHNLFRHIKLVDHLFLIINGLLLMVVTLIPFPTSLVVAYIKQQPDSQQNNQQTAAFAYSGTSLLLALTFFSLWLYASSGNRLLGTDVNQKAVQNITKQYRFGPIFYLVAFVLAFISAWLSLGLCLLLALFFALPSSIVSNKKRDEQSAVSDEQ